MRHFLVLTVLLLALPALAGTLLIAPSALAAEVDMPDPIPALEDPKETRRAIIAGMAIRNWQIERETPERILATLKLRRHVAKTWIDYSTDQVSFTYGGSVNLECKLAWPMETPPRCTWIHGRYNTWLRTLRRDIAMEVTKSRDSSESASRER
jgi:hypothetical protein